MNKQRGRTRPLIVTDQPSLLARIERAIYRLQNTHGLPLTPLDDGSDPEVVLRDCADDHVHMRRVLCELREAVLEQVGKDQTDRLRGALADVVNEVKCRSRARWQTQVSAGPLSWGLATTELKA